MNDDLLNNDLINRFEEMLEENERYYFDGEEFNEIIGYYLDVGDLPFAYKAIEYALQLHPGSVEMQVKVLEYMLEVDMLKEAAELIEELKDVMANEIDFIIAQAKFWSLKNQHRRAISFYKKALDLDVENEYIHHCLGIEYLQLKEIGQALFHFKSALDLDIDDVIAFNACIQCFEEIGRTRDCIDFLNQYINFRPYSDFAWFQLGLQYLKLKDYHKAVESFDFAVCIQPKSINNLMQLAFCYEQLNDYNKAIETYIEALEYDDSPAYTLMKIGKCHLKNQDVSKALAYFHKAIHEDPQLDKAWSETSEIYESFGDFEEAAHYLTRAVELDSMHINYWKRLAFLNIQIGKYEEAEINYEKILKLEPSHFLNWMGYTELLIVLGEYRKAIQVAERGLKKFNRAELYFQISCCEYLLNHNEKGLRNFNIANALNPKLTADMMNKYPILKMKTGIRSSNS